MKPDVYSEECSNILGSVLAPGIFIWEGVAQSEVQGKAPVFGLVHNVCQKLKQFPDIVYRMLLQRYSKFKNFAQFTSWLLTSMFHGRQS